MNTDDIIYLSLLVFCMCFGLYYRNIYCPEKKKYLGAAVGLLIATIVSGVHLIHVLIITTVSALLILWTDKRKCQIYVFAFAFAYLAFFRTSGYFGIPYGPAHTNLILMMLALKLVGLAFEVNTSYQLASKKGGEDRQDRSEDEQLDEETCIINELKFVDIFCYTFCYCGVLTGPYFRYRTYVDHLYKPYHKYDNFKEQLLKKAAWLPILMGLHLVTSYYWPLDYIDTADFRNRSFFYRYWYIWPAFAIFRSRIYAGLILTEIVCIFAGFGVYPAFTTPKAGHGPTKNFRRLKDVTENELKIVPYDYETIHCIDVLGSDLAPTSREAMKHWNITVQYWLASYVYKKFPVKKYRTTATMMMSAFWHGVYIGYYFCIGTVPITLMFFEDIWVKILIKDKTGKELTVGRMIMLFLKTQLFSYQIMSFILLEISKIIRYYNSVYHCILIFHTGMYFFGKYLLKVRKSGEKCVKD